MPRRLTLASSWKTNSGCEETRNALLARGLLCCRPAYGLYIIEASLSGDSMAPMSAGSSPDTCNKQAWNLKVSDAHYLQVRMAHGRGVAAGSCLVHHHACPSHSVTLQRHCCRFQHLQLIERCSLVSSMRLERGGKV